MGIEWDWVFASPEEEVKRLKEKTPPELFVPKWIDDDYNMLGVVYVIGLIVIIILIVMYLIH